MNNSTLMGAPSCTSGYHSLLNHTETTPLETFLEENIVFILFFLSIQQYNNLKTPAEYELENIIGNEVHNDNLNQTVSVSDVFVKRYRMAAGTLSADCLILQYRNSPLENRHCHLIQITSIFFKIRSPRFFSKPVQTQNKCHL